MIISKSDTDDLTIYFFCSRIVYVQFILYVSLKTLVWPQDQNNFEKTCQYLSNQYSFWELTLIHTSIFAVLLRAILSVKGGMLLWTYRHTVPTETQPNNRRDPNYTPGLL